jgi:hypothetical protein
VKLSAFKLLGNEWPWKLFWMARLRLLGWNEWSWKLLGWDYWMTKLFMKTIFDNRPFFKLSHVHGSIYFEWLFFSVEKINLK